MFWQSLDVLGKVYFILGCIGTAFLALQFILLLFGFAGDADIDTGVDADVDGGIGLFTLKGITGFLAIGGWTGLAVAMSNLAWYISLPVALVCGLAAFFGIAFAYNAIRKLQASGNEEVGRGVGQTAEVYLTIPSNNNGHGKVTITLQGKLMEVDAVTNNDEPIPTGEFVKVESLVGDKYLVSKIKGVPTQEK